MSWFTEFSERAENILNTIDKNAAIALNKQMISKNSESSETFVVSANKSKENDLKSKPKTVPDTSTLNQGKFDMLSSFNQATTSEKSLKLLNYQSNVTTSKKERNHDFLQNEMLQNEIHSLNNEITLLLNRVKIAEQKSVELSNKLTSVESENTVLEEQIFNLISEKYSPEEIAIICNNLDCSKNLFVKSEEKMDESTEFHEHYDNQIQELLQEKCGLEEKLQNKEDEIIMLKSRLSQKTYCFSADELQSRLRALTITLVQKQSTLESLTSEKNALALKLSQLQKRYDEVKDILHQSRINMNDTDDVKAQIPVYKSSGKLMLRLKQLCLPINILGNKIEILLQRSSTIKFFFIFYLILMHVLIFLLTFLHMPESSDT